MTADLEFGSSRCICPKCGHETTHSERGVPCSEKTCPKCGSALKGIPCND